MSKPLVATTSLAGCFGCHMSFLDIDERILRLVELVDFGKSPITDIKTFTQQYDIGIIEGYHAKISYSKTDHQLKAIITLRAFMGRLKSFIEKVKEFNEVINCYRITGNENIVMEVVLKDQKHLEQFIDQLIVYGETKTQIVLSSVVRNNGLKPL